jgi:ketose-bisphosphate aldolase
MKSLKELIEIAYRKNILIPAFNVVYLPMTRVICETLKEMETFGFVEVSRIDVEKFFAESFEKVSEEYYKWADPYYVKLHLDHIPVIDEDNKIVNWEYLIKEGIKLGYHSVMIDGSRLPLNKNIECTKRVVELAHSKGVLVEGELGAVFGHESHIPISYDELFLSKIGFTNPEEAEIFVKETGIDLLSVAIGNIHGPIVNSLRDKEKISAKLDISHLKILKEKTNIPLVLHGGSGIKINYIKEAIQNGITKINIATEIRQLYEKIIKNNPKDIDLALYKVKEKIIELIELFGIKGSIHILYKESS